MKIVKLLLCLALLIQNAHAQLNFGQDTALLIQLVTTTASQLNELEKLVTNAEKYTQKMQQYNELAQDEYFRAERVLYLAETVATKKEVENLDTLNSAIRELKYSMEDMQGLMREYDQVKGEEKRTQQAVKIERKLVDKKRAVAKSQVDKSSRAGSTGRSGQLTAQNTALLLEGQSDMQDTQLQILEKVATTNRLLAEQMEDKRLEQMQRERSYRREGGRK